VPALQVNSGRRVEKQINAPILDFCTHFFHSPPPKPLAAKYGSYCLLFLPPPFFPPPPDRSARSLGPEDCNDNHARFFTPFLPLLQASYVPPFKLFPIPFLFSLKYALRDVSSLLNFDNPFPLPSFSAAEDLLSPSSPVGLCRAFVPPFFLVESGSSAPHFSKLSRRQPLSFSFPLPSSARRFTNGPVRRLRETCWSPFFFSFLSQEPLVVSDSSRGSFLPFLLLFFFILDRSPGEVILSFPLAPPPQEIF